MSGRDCTSSLILYSGLRLLFFPHSNEVIFELLKTKRLPSLLHGTEACPVNKSVLGSLEFVINNVFRKIFSTKSYDIANECVLIFNCFVSDIVYKRKAKFLSRLKYSSDNMLFKLFLKNIQDELLLIRHY